jgi:serine/threonine protein phosphatase PrpC
VLRAETIEEALRDYEDVEACAARLIDLALRAGGPDNITVVVAEVVGEEAPQPPGLRAKVRGWLGRRGAPSGPSLIN